MKREPRDHQRRAAAMARDAFRRGKRKIMVKMPTGAGKTFVAAMFAETALSRGLRVLFIVDAISLVDQTIEAFYSEGLSGIGVIQANHPLTDWSKPLLIASVQTLRRRGMPKDIGLVIIDEAHCQDEWLKQVMASGEWADVPFIGLSATPWSKGLGHQYEELIDPVSMRELIDLGLLCDFRVFAAAHPDLRNVKTVAGDFHEGQLAELMSDGDLVADIVTTWKRLGGDRPTIAFCVDRAHAAKVQARFVAAGIGCGYVDSYVERADRLEIRKQLDRGEIKVVASVGCLIKGIDWAVGCIILARPTKSEMAYVQMVGRGLRVNEGIPDCVILDHADNTLRMGFVTDIHHGEMCKAVKGERKAAPPRAEALPKECASCSYLKPPKIHQCPSCGFTPEKRSEIEEKDGELVQLTQAKARADKQTKQEWFSMLRGVAREKGYSSGWVANSYRKRFGVWPRQLNENAVLTPSHEVRNFVKYLTIQFAKRRQAA